MVIEQKCGLSPSHNPSSSYGITLINVSEQDSFCYSLPLIKGYVAGCSEEVGSIVLQRLGDEDNSTEATHWPVVNGNFKCLASLQAGTNQFLLQYKEAKLYLTLELRKKQTSFHVLPVYIICKGSDGSFQAPQDEDNSPDSACRRIALGSRLIQSLTAEKLHESELGRRTFQLAADMGGEACVVFHSKLTPEEVYEMEPEEIWEHFGRELMSSQYGSDRRKFLAFLSCTRYLEAEGEPETYEEMVGRVQGHVALGGGGLAIFGTACLHTWAETIPQVVSKFGDETRVDRTRLMDDSCYRGTFGSCFSTTLGSVCHELDHTFDLGHSRRGIMGRGFDNTSLVFTIAMQSRDANKNVIARSDAQHATVCFTRDLSVTYTMSSPIKRPRGKPLGLTRVGPLNRLTSDSSGGVGEVRRATPTSDIHQDGERRPTACKVPVDDLTFWEKSCCVLLRFHKWFADTEPSDKSSFIELDADRNTISSPSGIRVIELREEDGLVVASWEFLSTYIPKQFTLPLQNMDLKHVRMVVAEDSQGNILKESFVTG